jgi:hypothetical protein
VELDGPDDRAVIVNAGNPPRTIGTSECEQLANYELPRCLGIKIFCEGWTE